MSTVIEIPDEMEPDWRLVKNHILSHPEVSGVVEVGNRANDIDVGILAALMSHYSAIEDLVIPE